MGKGAGIYIISLSLERVAVSGDEPLSSRGDWGPMVSRLQSAVERRLCTGQGGGRHETKELPGRGELIFPWKSAWELLDQEWGRFGLVWEVVVISLIRKELVQQQVKDWGTWVEFLCHWALV